MVKVVTINILFDMECWKKRSKLLVDELKVINADLIALQEINIQEQTGHWLAQQLNMPYMYLVPFQAPPYINGPEYGIGILSRYPFVLQQQLDLKSQGRLAQYVQVNINNQPLIFCNGHYYWQPGATPARMEQFKLLVNWLSELSSLPIVVVGDFNATPDTPEIEFIREHFISAYAAYHGQEPEYTCPTPLMKTKNNLTRTIGHRVANILVHRKIEPWRGTLDYIFINQRLQVYNCELILTKSAPDNQQIYASDHFGIVAELKVTL
ncbi:MAG: endonuclease/exonuclease/phosphatase family protein [Calothrix sp. FI2-JRJ7]|jgi:endonuclease/exonuclease/phosphatase family metal-dependent hydrolase|nr:endonuclease/exonuclease/phosphatase family protein [Calothrix sp. FI2-JRJ7]